MGIGWLWIYTHSDNPEALARENDSRAFAIYSRWRAINRLAANIYKGLSAFYRKRLSRRTLLALSDHQLQDIGMFRTGSDVRALETRRLKLPESPAKKPENTANNTIKIQNKCAVIVEIDRFKTKPKTTRPEPKLKVQCG